MGNRAPSDILFDQVVSKSKVCQDSHSPVNSKQKMPQTREKRDKAQKIIKQDTPTIFQLDDIPKFQKGKKRQLMKQPTHKKKTTISKKYRASLMNSMEEVESEPASLETLETSLTLNIEPCNSLAQGLHAGNAKCLKPYFTKKSKLGSAQRAKISQLNNKGYNLRGQRDKGAKSRQKQKISDWSIVTQNLQPDSDLSSIELPRDESVVPLSFLRKGSPVLFPLAQSIICNNSGDDLLMEEEEKMPWVSISSGPKDSQTEPGSSKYTFISTYTYGSTTAKSGSKVSSKSPTLFLSKAQSQLNSSLQKGKRNIKDMAFPDFISPIGSNKVKAAVQKETMPNTCPPVASEKKLQKCSTLFLESSSCQVPLESPGLTAIPSISGQLFDQRKQTSISGTLASTEMQQHDDKICASTQKDQEVTFSTMEKQQQDCKMRASTPKDQAVLVSLNLSPVCMASWDEEELGLPIRDSIEVNTSEIIVPSFLEQITDIPRINGSRKQTQNSSKINDVSNQQSEPRGKDINQRQPGLERPKSLSTKEQEEKYLSGSICKSHHSLQKRGSSSKESLCSSKEIVTEQKDSPTVNENEEGLKQFINTEQGTPLHTISFIKHPRSRNQSQGMEEFELEHGKADLTNMRHKNQKSSFSEKKECSVAKAKCPVQPVACAVESKRPVKFAASVNPHLPLCFVNRLCKQHRETQRQKMVSAGYLFSTNANMSKIELRQD